MKPCPCSEDSDFETLFESLKRAAGLYRTDVPRQGFQKQFTCAGQYFHFRYAVWRGAPIGCFQQKGRDRRVR